MKSPVLMLVFNRPHLTQRLFEAVRAAQPPVLLVAADGPRADRPDDARLCTEVRAILRDVDWPCEVHYRLLDSNVGCDPAVATALDWTFELVDRAIVLEDDCLPDPGFFSYCDEMLDCYADDTRVWHVAGSNLGAPEEIFGETSYAFASFPVVWGWATWRRAWSNFDMTISGWPEFRDAGMLKGLHAGRSRRWAMRREYDRVHVGPQPWDRPWQFTVMSQHALSVYPRYNQIANVGFGADATHTQGAGALAAIPTRTLQSPLVHPTIVSENPRLERHLEREVLRAEGLAVTILRQLVRSKRIRRGIRRVVLPHARHAPAPGD